MEVEEDFSPEDYIQYEGDSLEYSDRDAELEAWSNRGEETEEDFKYDDYEDLFAPSPASSDQETDFKNMDAYKVSNTTMLKERAQLIILRRHLDALQEKLTEKEFNVLKAREELNACRTRIRALQEEKQEVKEEKKAAEDSGNTPAFYRLTAKGDKLSTEIESDNVLEKKILETLHGAEMELSRVELEQRHYLNLGERVAEKEEEINYQKEEMAKYRMYKEAKELNLADRRYNAAAHALKRRHENQVRLIQNMFESAKKNNVKAKDFLQQSLNRIKRMDEKIAAEKSQHLTKRMKSIVDLKSSVANNRENLRALQARDAAFKRKERLLEKEERQKVLAEGGNPEQVLLRRKIMAKVAKEKSDFEQKQREEKANIAEKILTEENRMKKRQKQQPQLWPTNDADKRVKPLKKRPVTKKIEISETGEPIFLDHVRTMEKINLDDIAYTPSVREDSNVSALSETTQEPATTATTEKIVSPNVEQTEDLAKPEFEGLWKKKNKNYKAPKDDVIPTKPIGATKMEQEILQKALSQHRKGITVKQVAAGREFKGKPFYSKPDVIHFNDFNVGEVYKKKVVITNVSYSINFCKLQGLSEHLKDFIKIDFKPPGQMSAGMSCDMMVTFKPMLSVDVDTIDFGSQIVGETIHKSVMLHNKGGLGTRFDFYKVPDKVGTTYTTETSLGRLTTAETAGVTPMDDTKLRDTEGTARDTLNKTQQRNTRVGRSNTQHNKEIATDLQVPESAVDSITKHSEVDFKEVKVIGEDEEETTTIGFKSEGDELKFMSPETEYSMLPEELKVGQTMSGEIAPFSSVRLDIIFSPSVPGDIRASFQVAFSDPNSNPITIKASANAIDVPVWIERQNVDLQICMYDRLYQDQIVVHNRATTALRLNFEVPKELKNHVELLPKTGYIQAQSTFIAQLKFLPRDSLAEEAAGLFDPETCVLETPMVIRVADQTRPVTFTLNAIVTSSDLAFEDNDIDFGLCSIYESVSHEIKLTNYSILPQKFGFLDLPDYVQVQPNDGFGTILPMETISLDIILSVEKARNYEFTLACYNCIGRSFTIHCHAVGVHPPLNLSHQVINFAATALGDTSCALLHVINSHTSSNEFTHPVPRIGKGEIVPVGPTSFEFIVPPGAPISITPSVGTVEPGKKSYITVHFTPTLNEEAVRREAVLVMKKQREEKMRLDAERAEQEAAAMAAKIQEEEKNKGKKSKTPAAKSKGTDSAVPKSGKSVDSRKSQSTVETPVPEPDEIDTSSIAYKSAHAALTRSHPGTFQSFSVPCFVATGTCSTSKEDMEYNSANTLFLDIHCPTIKPPAVVISNHGQNLTEFGQVSIGQNIIKEISIQNISDQPIDLELSLLDTNGPFQVLNALRTLTPDETHTLLVSFTPNAGKLFYEVLDIRSPTAVLSVALTGQGVSPVIKTSVEGGVLDVGHVLVGETISSSFTLENSSSLKIDYNIRLDSGSLHKHIKAQNIPQHINRYLDPDHPQKDMFVGVQNLTGSCVFDCVPCDGAIETGKSHEITVNFTPDHSSSKFSDGARIVLFNSDESHVIQLRGHAHDHMMYVDDYDSFAIDTEAITVEQSPEQTAYDSSPPMKTIFLMFKSNITDEGFSVCNRSLTIGCLKTTAFAAKRNGEWVVENLQHAQSVGFTVDQPKGSVEIDGAKQIEFSWNPPEGHDPTIPIESNVLLTLKADVPLLYNVLLRGLLILH